MKNHIHGLSEFSRKGCESLERVLKMAFSTLTLLYNEGT